MRIHWLGALALALAAPAPIMAQAPAQSHIVSIYRAAPGHQIRLLQWFARQDQISRSAGLPPAQLFVHQDGASWDFMIIAPQTTPEQDAAVDEAARRAGAPVGPRSGIELREHIAEHSDTFVAGPTTAAEWLRRLEP
jgi:hypothetical protein